MKLKYRVITLVAVGFIIFISYKILEPELNKAKDDDEEINIQLDDLELQREHREPAFDEDEDKALDETREAAGVGQLDPEKDGNGVFVPHVGLMPDKGDVDTNPLAPVKDIKKDGLVAKFLRIYDVTWDEQLADNAWQLADSWVTTRQVHADHVPQLGGVLKKLATAPIMAASVGYKGSQLKLSFMLQGGRRASFKPKWYPRDYIVHGLPYDGRDKHNAEIASYHLQRLLGYNRAPIVVGKTVDLAKDILPVADDLLSKTFFKNGSNTCFYGKCLYCNSPADGVCAEGTRMEGALFLWLPKEAGYRKWRSPWQRVYEQPEKYKAKWEVDNDYCDAVREQAPYDHGPRLMDLMDAVVFDYLIGNADRHHYETFSNDEESFIIMFDSAKSFGQPHWDEQSILAPLYQCCQIRLKTFQRLQELQNGVLSTVLRHILSRDPIAPVLHEFHYPALDRRLTTILTEVDKCVTKHGKDFVFIEDHYEGRPLTS